MKEEPPKFKMIRGMGDEELNETLREERELTYASYLKNLDLTEEQLKGKKILDIAAGNAFFATELRKRIPEANISSVDNMAPFRFPQGRFGKAMRAASDPKNQAVGDAAQLPFKENSFDLTVTDGFVPESVRMLEEAFRVIRSGGENRWATFDSSYEDMSAIAEEFQTRHRDAIVEIQPLSTGHAVAIIKKK